jgi:hypothetical protein
MSNKITYVLEVLDRYSKNTIKFKKEISSLEKCLNSINSKLKLTSANLANLGSGVGLSKAVNQTDSLKRSIDRLNQSNKQSINIANQATVSYNKSLGNRRKTLAGPYTPIRFDPEAGKFQQIPRPQPTRPQRPSGFLGGDGVSFTGVAKAMGYYTAIDKIVQSPKLIYENTKSMDSLRASLSALIPNVKGLEGVSVESEVNYIRSIANKYGVGFSDIAPSYMKILGSGGADASLAKGILENVSGYGRLVGLSAPAMQDTLRGIQDMLNKQKINAQEFNLQMQQLVGAKPMFFEAFRRVATRSGAKGVTKENAGALFYKYMEEGKLPSAPILREFVNVVQEMFGQKMLEKAKTIGAEEERLRNSFQELGTTIGDLTYSTQIGAIRGLTGLTISINQFANDAGIVSSYIKNLLGNVAPEGGAVRKTASVLGGTALDVGKMTYGSPFYAAKYGGAYAFAQVANLMGDSSLKENYSEWAKEEFFKNNFEDLQGLYKTDFMTIINALKEGQKVEIKIDGPNVSVRDVKSNRPSTVIAGGR